VRARTVRLDGDVDLLDVAGADGVLFEQAGVGLAGRGVALRVGTDEAEDALSAIDVEDDVGLPGCGPVAFAALPFDPAAPGEAVIPRLVVGRAEDGTRWRTVIGDDDEPLPPAVHPGEPTSFTVRSVRSVEAWCEAVAVATKAVRDGRLRKVVLAREVVVEADRPLDVAAILGRLRHGYPSCMVFSVDGFIGASPELLVSRTGDVVRSQPMAGTAPRSGDPSADARLAARLLASAKEREEHQITIDMAHDTLLPWCSYLDALAEPTVVPVANAQHLATLVEGRLSSPAPSALTLARALHPTPAVGGSPTAEAMAVMAELEELDRGRYAGPVGWVDAAGNGRFAVGIRSAEVSGSVARLFAGVGVVADSDVDAELAETRVKLQPLLSAVVRP
jgi:isochorismate synthase